MNDTEGYFAGMSEEEIKDFNDAIDQMNNARKEQRKKDTTIIRTLKKQLPRRIFRAICNELHESDEFSNLRISEKPIGKLDRSGIIKVWIEQWSVGDSGDSFNGYVSIELPDGKFLIWDYSM